MTQRRTIVFDLHKKMKHPCNAGPSLTTMATGMQIRL